MNQQLNRKFAMIALDEMRKKLSKYAEKSDANQVYLQKNKSYLDAIGTYISELETELLNQKFNAEFLIVTEEGNSGARLKDAQQYIKHLESLLELKGINATDRSFLLKDIKEIERANSISRAMSTWEELY